MSTKFNFPGMDLVKGVGFGPLNVGNVLDTMGFVKKAWGSMNAPTSFAPTMDVEELERRITDLRVVEQWLSMNTGMIQASIQALEVQRATISTLKGVAKGFVPNIVANAADSAAAALAPATPASNAKSGAKSSIKASPKSNQRSQGIDPGLSASAWLEFLQAQFNQVAQAAMSGAAIKPSKGKPAASKASAAKSTRRTPKASKK